MFYACVKSVDDYVPVEPGDIVKIKGRFYRRYEMADYKGNCLVVRKEDAGSIQKVSMPSPRDNPSDYEGFVDERDGKKYRTTRIGDQTWSADNLSFATPQGSWLNDERCGRLYDLETALKSCPPGWHLPTRNEWETLLSYLKRQDNDTYTKIIGDGTSHFNCLFAGHYSSGYGNLGKGTEAHFWSSTYDVGGGHRAAWIFEVIEEYKFVQTNSIDASEGLSVRYLKNTN